MMKDTLLCTLRSTFGGGEGLSISATTTDTEKIQHPRYVDVANKRPRTKLQRFLLQYLTIHCTTTTGKRQRR